MNLPSLTKTFQTLVPTTQKSNASCLTKISSEVQQEEILDSVSDCSREGAEQEEMF
jgi:hypothetical protein